MKQSEMFLPFRREDPKDERFANAKLLIRAGFVDKLSAGVFTILPLGLRVLDRIESIIREEMNRIGGQEFSMPSLQTPALWEETGRWASLRPEMFQFHDREKQAVGLAMTHEEVAFDLVRRATLSYRDFPLALYQFQTKFRDELRPKSGLIRGREFLMKDMYSFHVSADDLEAFYETVAASYAKIFERCDLRALRVEASGGVFTKNPSHEFQVVADAGEDEIAVCTSCNFSQNAELARNTGNTCPRCSHAVEKKKSVEVGNIFRFYDLYARKMNGFVLGADGEKLPLLFCSYGIGLGRLMAAIAETHHDARGLCWPESVAPFAVHVLALGQNDNVFRDAASFVEGLQKSGFAVLYDDRRDVSVGEKLYGADRLGIPWRVVFSEKTVAESRIEVKRREADASQHITPDAFLELLRKVVW